MPQPAAVERPPDGHGAAGARVAEALRSAILDGRYAPGERIRQEVLAERYGASRVPVREALRMLDAEGLVTLVANTGAWVSRISLAECEEMYQIRERIEPLLLRFNLPLLSPADVAELARLADAMEATDDVEEFLALDRAFHLSCYDLVPTSVLGDLVRQLWNRTQHYRRAFTRVFRAEGDRSVHHEHHLLVAALRRGDADEAERVLAGHIRRTRLELARHPEVFSDS
ncbi:GntR family transcriptional regulator [Microbacterium sp. BK668]|uniref:GntR family transcriptional regulator n=1 Tax=Microbacterium sp. BK668 TaxID=2512118 RepID=UPI001060D979|nr:GntR family transcriptional regulator [Microbacterium sp. BK668]TDN92169.1 GntR family transcriptional regulator [Microbacterium sp. BK668]